MKQHLTAEEWGQFEREHPKAADKLKSFYCDWIIEFEKTNYPGQFISAEYKSFHSWFTIGHMIEYLDKNSFSPEMVQWKDGWSVISLSETQRPELCDALWEAIKDTLEDDALDISLCQACFCMTHTIKGKCGKCGAEKDN